MSIPNGMEKGYAKLARKLAREGWTITETSKGHIRWQAPSGAVAITLKVPNGRTYRNGLAAIRRAGAAPKKAKK